MGAAHRRSFPSADGSATKCVAAAWRCGTSERSTARIRSAIARSSASTRAKGDGDFDASAVLAAEADARGRGAPRRSDGVPRREDREAKCKTLDPRGSRAPGNHRPGCAGEARSRSLHGPGPASSSAPAAVPCRSAAASTGNRGVDQIARARDGGRGCAGASTQGRAAQTSPAQPPGDRSPTDGHGRRMALTVTSDGKRRGSALGGVGATRGPPDGCGHMPGAGGGPVARHAGTASPSLRSSPSRLTDSLPAHRRARVT